MLGSKFIGIDAYDYLSTLHIPSGSFIVAGIISFLPEKKKVFLFLGLGVLTQYSLDLILEHVSGGIYLLYPFTWWQWQLEVTNSSDYLICLPCALQAGHI